MAALSPPCMKSACPHIVEFYVGGLSCEEGADKDADCVDLLPEALLRKELLGPYLLGYVSSAASLL